MPEQVPSIGRLVHYVLEDGPSKGQHRPALIVRVWGDPTNPESYVNLQVFVDGTNDGPYANGMAWRTSVQPDHSATPQPHTWHWPEYVPAPAPPTANPT